MDSLDPTTLVDLTNCDREPIHLLGAIQPIGCLIALTADWLVARVSANISEFFAVEPASLIGRPITVLFIGEAIHTLRNRLALLRGQNAVERVFRLPLDGRGDLFDVALHMSGGQVVIECEPSTEHDYGDATGTVRGMISRLDQARDMTAFFAEGTRQVRALTGFDRVMLYRFAHDLSGEVVAESAKSGIGSFFGLHYPATDIPAQARELYKRSLVRMITDIEATPVPIVPPLDEHKRPFDLSLSVLRSVSPIHIEYLRNMGVRASMSISLVVEGELWGLIACHHYSPRCPGFERRSVAEMFAQMFAMRIESRIRKQTVEYERRARDISDQLLGAVASDESLLKDPDWLAQLLTEAIPSDGIGVWINGHCAFSGRTPDTGHFARIVAALNSTAAGKIYATDRIADLVPDYASSQQGMAGMMAIPISRSPRDYVVLFREEMIRSVRWAGDPHKPVEHGPKGPRLTPRKSFDEWRETVEGRSQRYSDSERRAAETIRATLIEVVLRLADEANVERKAASDKQELLIAELNHRVRNILSLIRGLIRQSKPAEGSSVDDFVKLVDGRVHALARAHNQITDDHWGPAPLKSLIDAETAAFRSHQRDRVETVGELVLLNPQAYSSLALVMHELVTNSAKYGSLSADGGVRLEWWLDNVGDLAISWIEHGGPRVAKPTRRGFGTTIIQHSVPYDLGGKAELRYDPDGFKALFTIPARHLSSATNSPSRSLTSAGPLIPVAVDDPAVLTLLAGKCVLLVEDSLIIALDADDILRRMGADDVVTEGNVAGAIAAIEEGRINLAVLDINLGDHDSMPIAQHLQSRGIPFLFATGYGAQTRLPAELMDHVVIQKPYTLTTMSRRLGELLAGSISGELGSGP